MGDARGLEALVNSLVDNAIKYTGSGGRIDLSLGIDAGRARLCVADTGCGIAEEHQRRVFERFFRADAARARDRGGSGLGLAIVKHMSQAHNGRVTVASIVGKGSTSNLISTSAVYQEKSFMDLGGAFGESLIFVGFCYSGWNAAAYVASEMHNPQRDLPRALMIGTGTVVILYLGLNAVYFYGASLSELSGKFEVGLVASRNLFGEGGATLVTVVLCVSILASASAMTIAGGRVYYAFGRDTHVLGFLGKAGEKSGAPTGALILQGVVTSAIILAGTIDQIQQYAGFTITLFGSLAVICVFVLRVRRPEMPRPFRAWGYPFTPLLFLVLAVLTMGWAIKGRPLESILGLVTVFIGGVLFYILNKRTAQPKTD